MLKILGKIILSISIMVVYIIGLFVTSVWAMNHKKVTIIFIQDFLEMWNISLDEFDISSLRKR